MKSGGGLAAIPNEWLDRRISVLKGLGDDDRRLQGANDISAFQCRFVLELPGDMRIDGGALSGGAAWPDYRCRPAPAILGSAARQSQHRVSRGGLPRMGRFDDDRRNALSAARYPPHYRHVPRAGEAGRGRWPRCYLDPEYLSQRE